ncbi:MAG TPA: hypothetical protein VIN08_19240 [Ohtaekwangia sp.]|uniref:hypothetical protein n=1 Tax=Ohtaekwangia sp. TaxID=2066019 RepID=UPI002F957648
MIILGYDSFNLFATHNKTRVQTRSKACKTSSGDLTSWKKSIGKSCPQKNLKDKYLRLKNYPSREKFSGKFSCRNTKKKTETERSHHQRAIIRQADINATSQ